MLLAPHPALNQVIGVMLGMALAVGDMANAWQEQHLPSLRVAANASAKVAPPPAARPTPAPPAAATPPRGTVT